MFAMDKFLFLFELEVGAFIVGMWGFTTSFMIQVIIVFLLYQIECFGLFKVYAVATVVSYYMFASFMLVKEIFCDRKPSIVKHFLVIDCIVTTVLISAYMRCYDFVPGLLPLFIIDVLFRFYSTAVIYSLLLKYREVARAVKKQKQEDYDNASNQSDLVAPRNSTMDNNDGVLKILDNFLFFLKLEVSAYTYIVVNILGSIALMGYLVVYMPIMGGKDGKGVELQVMDLIIYIVVFVINFAMTLSLLMGVKMRKSSIMVPFLIFNVLSMIFGCYLILDQWIDMPSFETYEARTRLIISNINVPEISGMAVWMYLYICIMSLFDDIRFEENEKKALSAKENITFGSIEEGRRSSSL